MATRIGELVGFCFQARTISHIMHLRTRGLGSEAVHLALEGFYKKVVKVGDALAEVGASRHGQAALEIPLSAGLPTSNPISMLKAFRAWIDDNRDTVSEHSEIQNMIDELLAEIGGTLYKLERLM